MVLKVTKDHGLSESSLNYLVDPTPDSPFTEYDYFNPINDKTIFRVQDYPYEDIQADFFELFSSTDLMPYRSKNYSRWWLMERGDEEENLKVRTGVDFREFEGDWNTGKRWPIEEVRVIHPRVKYGSFESPVTRSEFEEEVSKKGFFYLGGLLLNSWDDVLEIAATSPKQKDKIDLGIDNVITREKIQLYASQMKGRECVESPLTNDFVSSTRLNDAEMNFSLRVREGARVRLPLLNGWAGLEYEAGATIDAHFKITGGYADIPNGEPLLSFQKVYLILRPENLVDIARERYGLVLSEKVSFLLAHILEPEEYYRIPVTAHVLFGGRPHLQLDLSEHPWFRGSGISPLFIETSLAADNGFKPQNPFLEKILGESSFRFQKDFKSDELLRAFMDIVSEGGVSAPHSQSFLPSSYDGTVKFRSLGAYYTHHPYEATITDGMIKADFNSDGLVKMSGNLPIDISKADNPVSSLSTEVEFALEGSLDGSMKGNILMQLDKLHHESITGVNQGVVDLTFSDLKLGNPIFGVSDVIDQLAYRVEVELTGDKKKPILFQGGGVYATKEEDFYTSHWVDAFGENSLFAEPVSFSMNGLVGGALKNFELAGLKMEVMPGVILGVDKITGASTTNENEIILDLKASFRFNANGNLEADSTFSFDESAVFKPGEGTLTFPDLSVPLPEFMLTLNEEGEDFPFLFSGSLEGPLVLNAKKQEVTGPFRLRGRLEYLDDSTNGGLSLLPSWIKMASSFSVHLPYKGVIYKPGNSSVSSPLSIHEKKLGKKGDSNQLQSVEGLTFTVNRIAREKETGNLFADMVIDAGQVELAHAPFDPFSREPDFLSGEDALSPNETRGADNGTKPLVLWEEVQDLNDWDIFLDAYGLDREKAKAILSVIRDTKEASLVIHGFDWNLPPSRVLSVGPLPIYVPKKSKPVLDIRVVDGKMERFHFYFTKPLQFPPGIPLIRGFYFEKESGQFRLDLINNPEDTQRYAGFYKATKSDPVVTKAFFQLLPLPEIVVDRLLDESKLDPAFLANQADRWLHFLFLTMMAFEESTLLRDADQRFKTTTPLRWDNADVQIQSIQFKPGARFSFGGVCFEFGCPHNNGLHPDPRDLNNVIVGSISLKDSKVLLNLENIGKLHMMVPASNPHSQPLDIMLKGGSGGEVVLSEEGNKTTLSFTGMKFDKASFLGSPFKKNIDLNLASNLELKEFTVAKNEEPGEEKTTIALQFDADVEAGSFRYVEGEKAVSLLLDRSRVHVASHMELGEMYDSQEQQPTLSSHPFMNSDPSGKSGEKNPFSFLDPPDRNIPVIKTVFLGGKWTVTSDDFNLAGASFTPGISFGPSHIRNAKIDLVSEDGLKTPSLILEGDFDWKSAGGFDVPLPTAQLLPRLHPAVYFDDLVFAGLARISVCGDRVSVEGLDSRDKPLLVSYSGVLSFNQTPDSSRPEKQTIMSSSFEGSHVFREGIFSMQEGENSQPVHLLKMASDQMRLNLNRLHGVVYVESPLPSGLSGFMFEEGEGEILVKELYMEEGKKTKLSGMEMNLTDNGIHHNHVTMKGNLAVVPGVIHIDQMEFEAALYDVVNEVRFSDIQVDEIHEMLLSQALFAFFMAGLPKSLSEGPPG